MIWGISLIMCATGFLVSTETTTDNFCPISSQDCSQDDFDCTIIRDPDCSWEIPPLETHDSPVADYPGVVQNLSVLPYHVTPLGGDRSASRVVISWGLPGQNADKLVGFRVRLSTLDEPDNSQSCFVLSISPDRGRESDDKNVEFNLTCTVLERQAYTIDVMSLPHKPSVSRDSVSAMLTITQKVRDKPNGRCKTYTDRSCYDTDIVVYQENCARMLHVTFAQAPDVFGIAYYDVYLTELGMFPNRDTDEWTTVVGQDSDRAMFLQATLNVSAIHGPNKEREIVIIPGCVGFGHGCVDSVSHWFVVRAESKAPSCGAPRTARVSTVDGNENLSMGDIAFILLGAICVAAVVTITLVICSRRRFKYCGLGVSRYESHRGNLKHKDCSRARKIHLVYSSDSPYHQNAVGCLYELLKAKGLSVTFDRTHFSDTTSAMASWLRQSLDMCDVILFVNSEGTYKKSYGRHNPSSIHTTDESTMDMFELAYQLIDEASGCFESPLIKKLVQCHFEYTAEHYSVIPNSQIQSAPSYRLTDQTDELLCRLDPDMTVETRTQDQNNTLASLENAIRHKVLYILQTPDWYQRVTGANDQSLLAQGYDSGIGHTLQDTTTLEMFSADGGVPRRCHAEDVLATTTVLSASNNHNYWGASPNHYHAGPTQTIAPPRPGIVLPTQPEDLMTVTESFGEAVCNVNKV